MQKKSMGERGMGENTVKKGEGNTAKKRKSKKTFRSWGLGKQPKENPSN